MQIWNARVPFWNILRDLDLTTLRLFVSVCETGNIARAGEKASIVGSAISKRLAQLEHQVGTPLLVRRRHGVLPTAAAFLLWGYALTHTPAGVLTSSSLIVPAITVVLAWTILGEVPPPLAALGGVLCLTGAAIAILPGILSNLVDRAVSAVVQLTGG